MAPSSARNPSNIIEVAQHHLVCQCPDDGKNEGVNTGNYYLTSLGRKSQENAGGQDEKKKEGVNKHGDVHSETANIYLCKYFLRGHMHDNRFCYCGLSCCRSHHCCSSHPNHLVCQCPDDGKNKGVNTSNYHLTSLGRKRQENTGTQNEKENESVDKDGKVHS